MTKGTPLVVACPVCQQALALADSQEETAQGPRIDVYKCETEGCGQGKIAVIFELGGGGVVEPGFVERQVARLGAFFPSDYMGANRGNSRRNW